MTSPSPVDSTDAFRLIETARLRIEKKWPYYAVGLRELRGPIVIPGLAAKAGGPIAVDKHWRIYVDPEHVGDWTVPQLATALRHELWHCLLSHHARLRAEGLDRHRVAIAVDHEVDSILLSENPSPEFPPIGHPIPGDQVEHATGLPIGLLAEEYYDLLPPDPPTPSGGASQPVSGDGEPMPSGGSNQDGEEREWEQGVGKPTESSSGSDAPESGGSGKVEGVTDAEAELIKRAVAEAVQQYHKGRGSLPGGLKRLLDTIAPPVDLRILLRRAVQNGVATRGRVDYSYARPSRRDAGASRGYVSPGSISRKPEVAMVIDTSGSMSAQDLGEAVSEVIGCARAIGGTVKVSSCDASASSWARVASVKDVTLTGGGGTDMRVGIDSALEIKPKPHVVVVVTDGETPWPSEPLKGSALVVILVSSAGRDKPPKWATTIRIERAQS